MGINTIKKDCIQLQGDSVGLDYSKRKRAIGRASDSLDIRFGPIPRIRRRGERLRAEAESQTGIYLGEGPQGKWRKRLKVGGIGGLKLRRSGLLRVEAEQRGARQVGFLRETKLQRQCGNRGTNSAEARGNSEEELPLSLSTGQKARPWNSGTGLAEKWKRQERGKRRKKGREEQGRSRIRSVAEELG